MGSRMTIGAVSALLLLAACDGVSAPADQQNVEAATADSMQAQLEALPEGQRNAVFIRAIRDSGANCQQVESSRPAGEYHGQPLWQAQCAGGSSYTIVIAAGGVAQILDDSQVRLANEAAPSDGSR
jgi:hypothetical protein